MLNVKELLINKVKLIENRMISAKSQLTGAKKVKKIATNLGFLEQSKIKISVKFSYIKPIVYYY